LVDLANISDIRTEILQLLSSEQAWLYKVVPFRKANQTITCYGVAGNDNKDELELIMASDVYFEFVAEDVIKTLLNKFYRKTTQDKNNNGLKQKYTGTSNDFLKNLISESKILKSSDIHIEIYDENCRVRLRIDGVLMERYILDKEEYPTIINKLKIMANLDIAEKRLPQDGRIFFNQNGQKFDIRVSVLPTLHGEKVVLRLLSNDATNIDIYKLGFSEFDLGNYLEGVRKPHGVILISGPTGSGKTTTLYATLKLLNKESRNILTIEDPIEYTLDGINQVQLKESIGLNFGSALRTFLRQDPDIIMVGEIRDYDTASMAIRASLTGHLVLSTIHTNSAWGTVNRLIDMGVPPFLVANTLNVSIAQRLVRMLCPLCKEEAPFDISSYPKQFKAPRLVNRHFVAKGCDNCFHTGYKGRRAVYEVVPIDMELGDAIKKNSSAIDTLYKDRDIKTLSENAFLLFESGDTSIEEIYSLLLNY
jgi:type IV pilus assembly protein PilB